MVRVTSGWELDVDRGPDWLLVKVRKPRVRGGELSPLADVLWSLLEQHFTHRLVLELDEIKVLNDDLIDQLLDLHDRISSHGGLMRVCGLSPRNRELLLQRRLDDRLVPYEDREEAVMGTSFLRHPR